MIEIESKFLVKKFTKKKGKWITEDLIEFDPFDHLKLSAKDGYRRKGTQTGYYVFKKKEHHAPRVGVLSEDKELRDKDVYSFSQMGHIVADNDPKFEGNARRAEMAVRQAYYSHPRVVNYLKKMFRTYTDDAKAQGYKIETTFKEAMIEIKKSSHSSPNIPIDEILIDWIANNSLEDRIIRIGKMPYLEFLFHGTLDEKKSRKRP